MPATGEREMLGFRKSAGTGEPFRFRVSDALEMPHRGYLLRLRVVDGKPSAAALKPGAAVRLHAPDGRDRLVRIVDHAVTGGKGGQARLDRLGEFDFVIGREDGWIDADVVEIGWTVSGPVEERGRDG
jgi:hypothetical protein